MLRTDHEHSVEAQFRLHQPALRRFLYSMVRDRALADDLLQDTFVEALRHPDRLTVADDPRAWLFAVARSRALNAHRSTTRLRVAVERFASRREQRDEPVHHTSEEEAALALLDGLDPATRALAILRWLHGFEAAELAEICGRNPAAVRKQLERARTKLVARLGPELEEVTA